MKYFTESHEWLDVEGDKATMGITPHAAAELGDITYVELNSEGDEYAKGDTFSVVESVKAASDIYAPVSCTIAAVNEELEDAPELINEDAFAKGWIYKLSGINAADLESMMSEEKYKEFIKG